MNWQSIISLLVFLITMGLIIARKLDKSLGMIFAGMLLILIRISDASSAFRAIDIEVIFLLIGMMLFVGIVSSTGFFQWIALLLIKFSKGKPVRIMIYLAIGTAVMSAFLDNVTTVLLISPVIMLICDRLEIPAVPFLIVEVFAANIGGTATLIGDPPNMIIGSAANLSFNDFLANTMPIVAIISIAGLVVISLVFRKKFVVKRDKQATIKYISPKSAIVDMKFLIKSLIVFTIVIIGFLIHSALNCTPAVIALTGAAILGIWQSKLKFHEIAEKVEWGTVFFLIGLFLVTSGMEQAGVMNAIAKVIFSISGGSIAGAIMSILWFSGTVVGLMSSSSVAALVPIVKELIPIISESSGISVQTLWKPFFWALSLGACLGGNSTIFGTTATIVTMGLIERSRKHRISFFEFLKYGVPTVLVSLFLSSIYLLLRYVLPLCRMAH